jgi:hypothetical protein
MTVSATKPVATYNAAAEEITVTGSGVYYALKYNVDSPGKARWFPVYGGGIDVTRLIPKKDIGEYTIGFVNLGSMTDIENAAANVTTVTMKGRAAAPTKADNKYDDGIVTLKDIGAVEARIGIGAWVSNDAEKKTTDLTTLIADTAIAEKFPFGATLEVRTKAVGAVAASAKALRIRIPAQPKAPSVSWAKVGTETIEGKKEDVMGLKGSKASMEMIITDEGKAPEANAWSSAKPVTAKMTEAAVRTAFGAAAIGKKDIHIRVAADKKPYSMVRKFTVDFGGVPATPTP